MLIPCLPLLGGFKHERDSGTLGEFGVGFLHVHLDAFAQNGAFAHAQDVVPSEIVVQVLGGHTTEAEREVLQIVVEGVDVIDVVHALLRACLETHLSIMKRFSSMLAMAI